MTQDKSIYPEVIRCLQLYKRVTIELSGCWLWHGRINDAGHGVFSFGSKTWLAHRLTYILLKDSIPAAMELNQTCKVRLCVNPEHMQVVTRKENLKRVTVKPEERVHCKNGHELEFLKSGGRFCRICKSKKASEYYYANQEKLKACARAYSKEHYKKKKGRGIQLDMFKDV